MLWRRTAHTPLIPSTGPVPDTEALRRMLLSASWQRGQWIARRRVALRWVLWVLRRYGLYVLLVAAAGFYFNHNRSTLDWLLAVTQPRPAVPPTPPVPPIQTAPPVLATEPPPLLSPEGMVLPDTLNDHAALPLRFDAAWPDRLATPAPASPQPDRAGDDTEPTQLKPENWLHSKEP